MGSKWFSKLGIALAGIAMAVGVGVGLGQKEFKKAEATPTTLVSWSRPETTDIITTGFTGVYTNSSNKSGYRQDNSNADTVAHVGAYKSSATILTTSSDGTIKLNTTIGGGTARNPLTNSVYAYYLDNTGAIIPASQTLVTNKITTAGGDAYEITMPTPTTNVYGVELYHLKEFNGNTGYNVRFYSFSLTYDDGSSEPTLELGVESLNVGYGCTNKVSVAWANLSVDITISKVNNSGDGAVSFSKSTIDYDGDSSPLSITLTGTTVGDLTVQFVSGQTSATLEVHVLSTTAYSLVTDASSLTAGTKFILLDSGKDYALSKTFSDGIYSGTDVTVSGSTARSLNAQEFTLGGSAGAWTLYDGTYYVGLTGVSSSSNKFSRNATIGSISYAYWEITIANEASNYVVGLTVSTNDSGNYKSVFYNYNGGNTRFKNYSSGSNTNNMLMYAILAPGLSSSKTNIDSLDTSASTTATLTPVNFGGNTPSYEVVSSDSDVVTGNVVGNTLTITAGSKAGSETLTVTGTYSTLEASVVINVTVIAAGRTALGIELYSDAEHQNVLTEETRYVGQGFDFEGYVFLLYDNDDFEDVTNQVTFSGYTVNAQTHLFDVEDSYEVEVTYSEFDTSYDLYVVNWSGELEVGSSYIITTADSYTDHPSALIAVDGTESNKNNVGEAGEKVGYFSTELPLVVEAGNTYNSYSFVAGEDGEHHPYYLAWSGNSTNTLYKTTTKDNNSSWTVSVSNGVYTISNVATPARTIQYNYNNGNPRFVAYSSSQIAVKMIKVTDEVALEGRTEEFIQTYMYPSYDPDRDNTGGNGSCYGTDGTDGYFAEARTALGKAKVSGGYADCAAKFAASGDMWDRYVKWGKACGVIVTYSEGLQYNVRVNSTFETISVESNDLLIAIIIIASVSALAIGGYFFIRRKHQ